MIFKVFTVFFTLFILAGCSGQKVYVWERQETGVYQFAEDHQHCMKHADFVPWGVPTLPSLMGYPKPLKLRARWEDHNGVWASYVPHRGADPVTVNYRKRSNTVSPYIYQRCMRSIGYVENPYLVFSSQVK